jgi:Zinc finger, C3HC4 type (RING finger)
MENMTSETSIGNLLETNTIHFAITKTTTESSAHKTSVYITHTVGFDEQKSLLQLLVPTRKYSYGCSNDLKGPYFLVLLKNQGGVILNTGPRKLKVIQHNYGLSGQLQEIELSPRPHGLLSGSSDYTFFEFAEVNLANPPGIVKYHGKFAPVRSVFELKLYNDRSLTKTSKKEEECVICTENESLVVLLPCKHTGFCVKCSVKFTESYEARTCPLCRSKIKEFKVFVV